MFKAGYEAELEVIECAMQALQFAAAATVSGDTGLSLTIIEKLSNRNNSPMANAVGKTLAQFIPRRS